MRTSISLSHKRDPDLIALYKEIGSTAFSTVTKDALRAIIRVWYVPKSRLPAGTLLTGSEEQETIKVNLAITSKKDEDIRVLLSHVSSGRRAAFIKQVLRFYLGQATVLSGFLDNEMSQMLKTTAVPMQVFAIGALQPEMPATKPKSKSRPKQKQVSSQRTSRTKTQDAPAKAEFSAPSLESISKASEMEALSFSTENKNTHVSYADGDGTLGEVRNTEKINTETNSSPLSEEDEMLAMLEGLLG